MRQRLLATALLGVGALSACSDGGAAAGAGGVMAGAGTASSAAGAPAAAGAATSAGAPSSAGSASASGGAGASGGPNLGGAGSAGTAGTESIGGSGGGGVSIGGSGGGGGEADGLLPFKGVANSACDDLPRLGASWWYNWTTSAGSCKVSEFVPMIAGKSEKTAGAVADALTKLKAAGFRTVLGFNEPNKADQANLSVAQVLELWPALTADPEVRVGSPATSADAKAWFEDFMTQAEAKSLRVDFVAVHWYGWNAGSCNDAKELESYLTWAEKFERPIWITEFGCMNQSNPSAEVVQAFYAAATAMLAKHASVERYAWYPWNTNNELVTSGNLTALGAAFAQAAAKR